MNARDTMVRDLYAAGLTLTEVGARIGRSYQTVSNILTRLGIARRASGPKRNHCALTPQLRELMDGLLLGDACLVLAADAQKSASLKLPQCTRRRGWLVDVTKRLAPLGVESTIERSSKPRTSIYREQAIRSTGAFVLRSLHYRELTAERTRWYPKGKKRVPADLRLSPITLAQWYFGDGTLGLRPNGLRFVRLCTNGFRRRDVQFLARTLNAAFGWHANVSRTRKAGPTICLSRKDEVAAFIRVVAPFAPACMKYKLRRSTW